MPTEKRRTILFLPKWYPDRKQDQNGNFIQQHAQAAAQFANVIVLYANVSDFPGPRLTQFEFKKDGGIPTFYFYYKQRITGIAVIDKLLKLILYFGCLSRGFRFVNRMYGRPDLLHVHVLLRTGLFAWYKCLSIGLPYVITEHWTLYLPQNAHKIGLLRKLLSRRVVKNAAALHTVSGNLKQAMQQLSFINKQNFVIPNVVDTDTFYPENDTVFSPKVRFLHVAILNDQAKNQMGLIRAFHALLQTFPEAELRIIGFGPSEKELKDLAAALGLLQKSVFFEGQKEAPEVAEFLRKSDVFVLPSFYETFGVVLIEALACGVPVIASEVGGVPEVFGPEQGILIPPRNEKALLEAMQFMCSHHQDFSKAALRRYAVNKFSYAAVGEQFADLYETILNATPKTGLMFAKILHTFTSRVGIAGLNFLIVILTAQSLGAAGRGEIGLFVANIALVLLFTSIVGGTGFMYLTPRTNFYQLVFPAYIWSFLVSALATLGIFLAGQVPENHAWHLFGLTLLQSFFIINTTVLLAKENVKTYNYLAFLQTLLTAAILAAGFLLFEVRTVAFYLVSLYVAYGFTTLLSFLLVFRLKEKPDFTGFRENLLQLFRLGATAQLSNVIMFLNYRLGYYFLNTLADSKAVGIFSVGVSLSEAIWMIGKSLATVQYSKIVNTESVTESQQITEQLARLSFAVTFLAVLFLALMPPALFQFIFGKEFGETNKVIWSLSLGIVATGTGMIFSHYFAGRGKYTINNWAALSGLLLTIPACWLLIPKLGPVGAGLASTLSYVAAFCFLWWQYRKETNFSLPDLLPKRSDLQVISKLLKK